MGDYDGQLPPYSYASSLGNYYIFPFWHQVIAPYMGKHNLAQAEGDYPEWPWRFGYVGPDDRLEFMPCPSQVCGPVPNACLSWFKRRQQTYLVNYPSVWGFHLPQATVTTHTSFRNSAILEKVPSEVWLIADGATNYTSRSSSHSHNPNGSGSWALTVDVDFDGIPDSSTDVFHCGPPFQFLDPLHNKTFNMLFVDSVCPAGPGQRLGFK